MIQFCAMVFVKRSVCLHLYTIQFNKLKTTNIDSRKEISKHYISSQNNQGKDNYVIQELPKHSALHTMGGWVGALSAHLGDCTLLPSWPPWITHGTQPVHISYLGTPTDWCCSTQTP